MNKLTELNTSDNTIKELAPFLYAAKVMTSARSLDGVPEAVAARLLNYHVVESLGLSSAFDELDVLRLESIGGTRPKSSREGLSQIISEAERLATETGVCHLFNDVEHVFISCILAEHGVDLKEASGHIGQEMTWREKIEVLQ